MSNKGLLLPSRPSIPCGKHRQWAEPGPRKSTPVSRRARRAKSSHSSTSYADPQAADASTSGREHATEPGFQKTRSRVWEKTAVLMAHKYHTLRIEERQKPLAEYMALPASQYSVLDAQRIERIDDDTFCCYVGGLKFFGLRVEPVLTVSVVVGPKGPTVKLLSTVLEGSSVVQAANNRFDATMTNIVSWNTPEDGSSHGKELKSDATIQVSLEVPGWMRAFPVSAIEKTGSSVMQRVLNRMLPRFLAQLQADYELWASGDTSRTPIGTGQL